MSGETIRTYIAAQKDVSAVKKAYLYRLYPTEEQAQALQHQLDVAREVYNACLLERREAYRMAGVTLNYYAQANQLKAIRRDRAAVAAVNFSMLQAICRRAQRAYETFFRRVKAGQPAGFPRFKSYLRFNSITFPSYGDGCRSKRTACTSRAWAGSRSSCTAPLVGRSRPSPSSGWAHGQ